MGVHESISTGFPANSIGIGAKTEGYCLNNTPCARLGTNAEHKDLSLKRGPDKLVSFASTMKGHC